MNLEQIQDYYERTNTFYQQIEPVLEQHINNNGNKNVCIGYGTDVTHLVEAVLFNIHGRFTLLRLFKGGAVDGHTDLSATIKHQCFVCNVPSHERNKMLENIYTMLWEEVVKQSFTKQVLYMGFNIQLAPSNIKGFKVLS